MRICLFIGGIAALMLGGCAPESIPEATTPEFRPVANVAEIMEGITAPAAQVVFDSVATIISEEGIEEKSPQTDEDWFVVRANALAIAESGNLLMFENRAVDQDEWMRLSQAMIDTGIAAAEAADAKDPEALLERGGHIYQVCTNCHVKYLPPDLANPTPE